MMETKKDNFKKLTEAAQGLRQAMINLGKAYKQHYLLPISRILNKFKKDMGGWNGTLG
jgi:hypothetical protein